MTSHGSEDSSGEQPLIPLSGDADALEITGALSAAEARSRLTGFWKVTSWLAFFQLDIPTLQGVIVLDWSATARRLVEAFADKNNYDALLLRTDRRPELSNSPRGGYLVGRSDLDATLSHLMVDGRIPYLLEPIDPQDDLYSINAAVWAGDRVVNYEIVGPGFDASDLKRGDLSPHEAMSVDLWADADAPGAITDHTIVSPSAYERSRRLRLEKVGRAAGHGPWPAEARGRDFLSQRGSSLLLQHSAYPPLPRRLIRQVHATVQRLYARLPEVDLPGPPFVVSATVTPRHRLIYWDVVWPSKKYAL